MITSFQNLKLTFSIYSEISAEIYPAGYDTELPNLATLTHVDIKILWHKFQHGLLICQAIILHTLEMLRMLKEIIFLISF